MINYVQDPAPRLADSENERFSIRTFIVLEGWVVIQGYLF
jgi:hypothetical protein